MLSLLAVAALAITGCSSNKETQEALADCAGAIATRYNAEVENSPSFIDFLSAEAADNKAKAAYQAVYYIIIKPAAEAGQPQINPSHQIDNAVNDIFINNVGQLRKTHGKPIANFFIEPVNIITV